LGDFSLSGNPEERLLKLHDSIISYISALRLTDLDVLQVEVLGRLVGCRRTTAELVEEIYGTPSPSDGYAADYYRVRRATRTLEEKGFISAPLFGRKKPYHLTRHGISVLANITPGEEPEGVLTRPDLLVHISTLSLLVLTALYAHSTLSWTILLPGLMLVCVGISVSRLASTIRKVI
jgi:hypothetical protein